MPGRDSSGPNGTGPNGRGFGPCGSGQGTTGRGRGFGRFNFGIRGFWGNSQTPENEKYLLENHKGWLETRLEEINQRLQGISKPKE